jgi:hypothetical protein
MNLPMTPPPRPGPIHSTLHRTLNRLDQQSHQDHFQTLAGHRCGKPFVVDGIYTAIMLLGTLVDLFLRSSRAAAFLIVRFVFEVLLHGCSITPYGATGVPFHQSTLFSQGTLQPLLPRVSFRRSYVI